MDKTFLGLTLTEWLAVIGAFAWLPTIIQWIKDYLKKPKLTIISGKFLDVGFTTFGPIINMSLAFLSENKKALINKVELELERVDIYRDRLTKAVARQHSAR